MAFQSASLAGISIERLQTLCAVVEAGSIAGAAGPDPNRQSQFSRQLKELEKALGTSLFNRIGKALLPNEHGRSVALASQTFFASLDEIVNAALAKADTIRLGAGESVLRWWIMPHLGELMAGEPPLSASPAPPTSSWTSAGCCSGAAVRTANGFFPTTSWTSRK